MATEQSQIQNVDLNSELFLDILTKEEKEALLNKKMEEIRKKNDAIRKRHEEIEADKKVAAKNGSYKAPMPKKERSRICPAEPSYNYLTDQRRDRPVSYHEDSNRRHHKNYGGEDFANVKGQMLQKRDKQQDNERQSAMKSKMEMTVTMTGKERRQYQEWKSERDRVDKARINRQKNSSGDWRRSWDVEKISQDYSDSRMEPAKRPAGRIGSGRFDRYCEERPQKMDNSPHPRGVQMDHDNPPPKGRGRGRGRGRGKGRGHSPEKAKMRQSFSSDSSEGRDGRTVECQRDSLTVKIDTTKSSEHDVEVEYLDEEQFKAPRVKIPSASNSICSAKSPSELSWEDELGGFEVAKETVEVFPKTPDHKTVNQFAKSTNDSTAKSLNSSYEDGENDPLKLNCKLNPDAPSFSPLSPEMKTPPGHVKVDDWVEHCIANLSPLSPLSANTSANEGKVSPLTEELRNSKSSNGTAKKELQFSQEGKPVPAETTVEACANDNKPSDFKSSLNKDEIAANDSKSVDIKAEGKQENFIKAGSPLVEAVLNTTDLITEENLNFSNNEDATLKTAETLSKEIPLNNNVTELKGDGSLLNKEDTADSSTKVTINNNDEEASLETELK